MSERRLTADESKALKPFGEIASELERKIRSLDDAELDVLERYLGVLLGVSHERRERTRIAADA